MNEHSHDWLQLKNKVCIVVGGARGIGYGVAEELLLAGAKVAVLARSIDNCSTLFAQLDPSGRNSIALSCDITDKSDLEQARIKIKNKLGHIYGVVNCAGIMGPSSLHNIELEEWQRILDTNLNGALFCMQTFSKDMIQENEGSIVQIGSIAAHNPQTFSGSYSASKAALEMLSRQTAAELGELGVRSNVICPGMTRTPLTESFYANPEVGGRRAELTANKQIGTPSDIANAALFLLSPRSKYINGTEIVVDGGFETMAMESIPRPGYSELRDQQRALLSS